MLGQFSSLTELHLGDNSIGDKGAGRLARMLGQCSLLAVLNLGCNDIGLEGQGCWRRSKLLTGCAESEGNRIGDEATGMLAGMLQYPHLPSSISEAMT